jgi:hypothetical protein
MPWSKWCSLMEKTTDWHGAQQRVVERVLFLSL